MESVQIKAPAKINLRLKVEGRRDDGYHLLSMLNAMLSFHDELLITRQDSSDGVSLRPAGGNWQSIDSAPEANLAGRAALAFLKEFGLDTGVNISLTKNIPAGAGLGGGSSDGAAVLQGLMTLFERELRDRNIECEEAADRCQRIALSLGADLPFFMSRRPLAFVEGIGDIIKPLPPGVSLNNRECVLVFPDFPVKTPAVYSKLRSSRNSHSFSRDERFRKFLEKSFMSPSVQFEQLTEYIANDLEEIVCLMCPELGELLIDLRKIDGLICSVSGSGSAIYVIPILRDSIDTATINRIEQIASGHRATTTRTNFLAIL